MNIGEKLNARDGVNATLIANSSVGERAHVVGTFVAEHVRDGKVIWREEFPNTVVTVGKNAMEDQSLSGSAYTVTGPFMGLVSSVGYNPTITTVSSGTYNNGTGAVSITTAGAHGLSVGDTFSLAALTGTGAFASLDGTWTATAGTTGSTLNFTAASGLGATTLTGGNVTVGITASDTMSSHPGWKEAGNANAPVYGAPGPRPTAVFSAAAGGVKALSAALTFTFTSGGTVKGAFLVFGAGAVSTVDNTAGTLFSAGLFATGDRAVLANDQLNVSWQLSM